MSLSDMSNELNLISFCGGFLEAAESHDATYRKGQASQSVMKLSAVISREMSLK